MSDEFTEGTVEEALLHLADGKGPVRLKDQSLIGFTTHGGNWCIRGRDGKKIPISRNQMLRYLWSSFMPDMNDDYLVATERAWARQEAGKMKEMLGDNT
jgi:hypothetical protein